MAADLPESELAARNAAFRTLFHALNPAQQRAVAQTEGPVLVLAGPGTGKTHLLAARVGKILLDTDARANNVLCLTFTDAAATAMRRRLLDMIGPEAYRVPIYTFHAFCNRVIQENRELFGNADLEPLTDLERIEIVRRLLDGLTPEHPLRAQSKDPYLHEGRLRDLFSLMKKERWTPGHIHQRIGVFLKDMPQNAAYIYQRNTKTSKKGDPKTAQIEAMQLRMTLLSAAADLYPAYQRALQRAGRYEYEDMLLWVLKAFEQHVTLLRNYQERFQYILVDEYQDTNGAQNQLLQHLTDFWETPNIFIVGDDDQSIYEFQGARLKNLLDFQKKYSKDLFQVVLEHNYRSTQPILDAAQATIGHNVLRAVHAFGEPVEKRLVAQKGNTPTLPKVRVYENRLHETTDVLLQIKALLDAGVDAADIAVLYARHQQAARLVLLLEKYNIAYQTKRPVNLLDLPLVQQFRELLTYLADELERPFSGEPRLFRLLHAPFFGYEPLQLARMALHLTQQSDVNWRTLLHERGQTPIEQWLQMAADLPLPQLVEQLYNQTGLLAHVLALPDKVWGLQVLDTLLEFVKSAALRPVPSAQQRTGGRALTAFLEQLHSMEANRLPIQLQQTIRTGNGVQLLTAHAAKGLEFEHVFLLDCTEDTWGPTVRTGGQRFTLPDTLTYSGEEDQLEARRRLFYVALTRAKTHLYPSYSRSGADGKSLMPVRFLTETALPEVDTKVPNLALVDAQATLLQSSAQPAITLPEEARLTELLAEFKLSITSLNRYLRCPLAFYYQDLLQLPEAWSESAVFGHAMHYALRQFFGKMRASKPAEMPPSTLLLRLFQKYMEQHRGYFAPQAYVQRLALGQQYLAQYYAQQIPYWTRKAVMERSIDRVQIDGVPVMGVVDRIEWLDGGALRLIDYKTGVPDVAKTAPPSAQKPNGGEFWRQLTFYKLLIDGANIYAETPKRATIAWVEPDRRTQIFMQKEWNFEPADTLFMRALITDTYARIQAKSFTQGCALPECPWCRMHRERVLPASFERPEEALDDGV